MKRTILVLGCAGVALCLSIASGRGEVFQPKGKTFYTQVNIHYEQPERIYSTNYLKGPMVPVGSEVTVLQFAGDHLVFREESGGVRFTIYFVERHHRESWRNLFKKYFGPDDPKGPEGRFTALSKEEQEWVQLGHVEPGMSRDAVLMSLGYPPSHRTPVLSANAWTYWYDRFRTAVVHFIDDEVHKVSNSRLVNQ